VLGNFTALVAVNNTLVVVSAGHAYAAASWLCNSVPVSIDSLQMLSKLDNVKIGNLERKSRDHKKST